MTADQELLQNLLQDTELVRAHTKSSLRVLRLDTASGSTWVAVTRKGLLELAKACTGYAEAWTD